MKLVVTQTRHAKKIAREVKPAARIVTLSELLLTSQWSNELSTEERQRVIADARQRDVSARSYICRAGEPVDYWFGVIEGVAKVSSMSASGRLMTFAGPGTEPNSCCLGSSLAPWSKVIRDAKSNSNNGRKRHG